MTTATTGLDGMQARTRVRPHDHAVFVYGDDPDVLIPFDHFLREGISAGELTTFVHAFPSADHAHAFLGSKLPDVRRREAENDLVVAHHKDAFERGGRIDPAHVEGVVGMLAQAATGVGRNGVRLFVDASKRYLQTGRSEEWFAFESWLGPRLHAQCGLVCAYQTRDLREPAVLARVLAAHAYRFAAPGDRIA